MNRSEEWALSWGLGSQRAVPPVPLQIGQQPIFAPCPAVSAGCQRGVSQLSPDKLRSVLSAAFLLRALHPLPAACTQSRDGCSLLRDSWEPTLSASCWSVELLGGRTEQLSRPRKFQCAEGWPGASTLPVGDLFLFYSRNQWHHQVQYQLQGRGESLPGMGLFFTCSRTWIVYLRKWCWLVVSQDSCPFGDQWDPYI